MKEENPHLNRRYSVYWDDLPIGRVMVIVFDRWEQRTIYKANVKERILAYPYIKEYYGESNCIPPEKKNLKFFI